MIRPPPRSPLFPYTPLFRSGRTSHTDLLSEEVVIGTDDVALLDRVADAGLWTEEAAPARIAPVEVRERSEEHMSELQSRQYLVCRLLLEKKNKKIHYIS